MNLAQQVGIGLLVTGGAGLALCAWLRRRWIRRAAAHADALIRPPVQKFTDVDDNVRIKTEQRRKMADGLRTRAAHVESGATAADVLKLARRA